MRARRPRRPAKKLSPSESASALASLTPSPSAPAPPPPPPAVEAEASPSARARITRDHRLREELLHPFRRPKATIFGTLCVSAFVGTLFAVGRAALGRDAPDVFLFNMAINLPAALAFGALARREVVFGRRALGVIASCPEARDLPVGKKLRLGDVKDGVWVVAGRARDLVDVLLKAEIGEARVVAVAVDAGALEEQVLGEKVWAPAMEGDGKKAWDAWLGGVERSRRGVALFWVEQGARGMGVDYLVEVKEKGVVDLGKLVRERKDA